MIVVTGAAGFIGSNLVWALNEAGRDDVVVCDWLGKDERWLNLRKRMFRDFVFPENLIDFCRREKPEAILHMGANSSTTSSDGDEILRVNTKFTLALIDHCAAAGASLIYASSAATYGAGESGFVDDDRLAALKKLRPLNLYGWSKHLVDLIVAERREKGLPLPPKCVGLKFLNVYGPNEYHKGAMMSVVGKVYETAAQGGEVELFKSHRAGVEDGGQSRDFVSVDDVVKTTLWFLDHGPAHGLYNVGAGRATTFRAFVEALFKALGKPPRIRYVPTPESLRDRYQYFTEASLANLRRAGYAAPFATVEEGVAAYVGRLGGDDRWR